MVRKANAADIGNIMAIIRETLVEMAAYGNNQWDETYPLEKDFLGDIQKGDLYVAEREGALVGFVCINQVEPAEYNGLPWGMRETALVVHRMAVNPVYRRNGIGKELMQFADELAVKNNIRYLKTDTYSINTKMNALFVKCGYRLVGEMSFLNKVKPFYCYERVLG